MAIEKITFTDLNNETHVFLEGEDLAPGRNYIVGRPFTDNIVRLWSEGATPEDYNSTPLSDVPHRSVSRNHLQINIAYHSIKLTDLEKGTIYRDDTPDGEDRTIGRDGISLYPHSRPYALKLGNFDLFINVEGS